MNSFDITSMPYTINIALFNVISMPMPIPAASMVFFLVNRDLNSMRKRKITWNMAQNMDRSLSIVILSPTFRSELSFTLISLVVNKL